MKTLLRPIIKAFDRRVFVRFFVFTYAVSLLLFAVLHYALGLDFGVSVAFSQPCSYFEAYFYQYLALISFAGALSTAFLFKTYVQQKTGKRMLLFFPLIGIITLLTGAYLCGLLYGVHDMLAGYYPGKSRFIHNLLSEAKTTAVFGIAVALSSFWHFTLLLIAFVFSLLEVFRKGRFAKKMQAKPTHLKHEALKSTLAVFGVFILALSLIYFGLRDELTDFHPPKEILASAIKNAYWDDINQDGKPEQFQFIQEKKAYRAVLLLQKDDGTYHKVQSAPYPNELKLPRRMTTKQAMRKLSVFWEKSEIVAERDSYDDKYALIFSAYKYFPFEGNDPLVKVELLDKEQDEIIAETDFCLFNDAISRFGWSRDKVFFGKNRFFHLPVSLSYHVVDEWYRNEFSLLEKLHHECDLNNDGLLDKYDFVDENQAYYLAICLNQGKENYLCIQSPNIENRALIWFMQAEKESLKICFKEEKRAMKWLRKMTFALDANANKARFLLTADTTFMEHGELGDLHIVNHTAVEERVDLSQADAFQMPEELARIRHNYFHYPETYEFYQPETKEEPYNLFDSNENANEISENWTGDNEAYDDEAYDEEAYAEPAEFLAMLEFLEAIKHDTIIRLQAIDYNWSKFLDYHGGAYSRKLPYGEIVLDGRGLTIEGVSDLTIEGNGASFSSFDPNTALVSLDKVTRITLSDLSLYHDVEMDKCYGPVLEVIGSAVVKIEHSLLDGSGVVGLFASNSEVYLEHSVITNCSARAIAAYGESNVFVQHSKIEHNYGIDAIFALDGDSKIELESSSVNRNTSAVFFNIISGEIRFSNSTLSHNYCLKKELDKELKYVYNNTATDSCFFNISTNIDDALAFCRHLSKHKKGGEILTYTALNELLEAFPIGEESVKKYLDMASLLQQAELHEKSEFLLRNISEKHPN